MEKHRFNLPASSSLEGQRLCGLIFYHSSAHPLWRGYPVGAGDAHWRDRGSAPIPFPLPGAPQSHMHRQNINRAHELKTELKILQKAPVRNEAVAAILDWIQLSSKFPWQLSELLKVFLSHSKSQEYFQTGFKNWILSCKSSFRYSLQGRGNPKWWLQAALVEHLSFPKTWDQPQPPDLQGRLEAKDSNPQKNSSLKEEESSHPLKRSWA